MLAALLYLKGPEMISKVRHVDGCIALTERWHDAQVRGCGQGSAFRTLLFSVRARVDFGSGDGKVGLTG